MSQVYKITKKNCERERKKKDTCDIVVGQCHQPQYQSSIIR